MSPSPYLLWRNYGSEGWKPEAFDTMDDMATAILNDSNGCEKIATETLRTSIVFTRPVKP